MPYHGRFCFPSDAHHRPRPPTCGRGAAGCGTAILNTVCDREETGVPRRRIAPNRIWGCLLLGQIENLLTMAEPRQPVARSRRPVAESILPVAKAWRPVAEAILSVAEPGRPVAEPILSVAESIRPVSEPILPVQESIFTQKSQQLTHFWRNFQPNRPKPSKNWQQNLNHCNFLSKINRQYYKSGSLNQKVAQLSHSVRKILPPCAQPAHISRTDPPSLIPISLIRAIIQPL